MNTLTYTYPAQARRAFTLIELMVVIGIIGLMIGGIGFALKGGDKTTTLQAAQGIMVSQLNLARAQAAMRKTSAGVFVNADSNDSDRYLRHAVVAFDNGGTWVPIDDGVTLPQGVYVVPQTGYAVNSTALQSIVSLAVGTSTPQNYVGFEITQYGTTGSTGAVIISTASIQTTSGSPVLTFDNLENVRGFMLSSYGIPTFINESASF